MKIRIVPPTGAARPGALCDITVQVREEDPESADLVGALRAFQAACRAGFFTQSPGSEPERYLYVSDGSALLIEDPGLGGRALEADASDALFGLLSAYHTSRGPLVVGECVVPDDRGRMSIIQGCRSDRDVRARLELSFDLKWHPDVPLGNMPVLRIDSREELDAKSWFEALEAWECLVARSAFGGSWTAGEPRQVDVPGSSELFMLSPRVLELAMYGLDVTDRAIVALLRFVESQVRDGVAVSMVELQR